MSTATKIQIGWLVALLVGAGSAATLAACSDDSGGTPLPAFQPRERDATAPNDDDDDEPGPGQNDSGAGGSDAGTDANVDCGRPATIRTSPEAGPFCPFQAPGSRSNCALGSTCCLQGQGTPSVCAVGTAEACPEVATDGGVPATRWECDENSDCGEGNACCLVGSGGDAGAPRAVPLSAACSSQFRLVGGRGTRCKASCAADDVEVCNAVDGGTSPCTAGTCVAVSTFGKDLGVCRR
jgi:hypothetical protein